MRKITPRYRTAAGSDAPAHQLEPLEPRIHLTAAFIHQTFAQAFNLPTVLYQVIPPPDQVVAGFGFAAAGVGDVDGDGRDDFAIAAPGRPAAEGQAAIAGRVFIYSGANGALIRTLEDGFVEFGFSLAGLGDVNGDGVPDLVVGSPAAAAGGDAPGTPRGIVYIFSGADGSIIHTIAGPTPDAELGRALAPIADLDADGVLDLLIGAPGAGGTGRVVAISGATGAELFTLEGEGVGDRFGHAVISAGDVPIGESRQGDGVAEILVGAPGADGEHENAGRVYLFDGATQAVRLTMEGPEAGGEFGSALAINTGRDARVRFAVGAPATPRDGQANAGAIYQLDRHGIVESAQTGGAGHRLGEQIVPIGDIHGDRIEDLAFFRPGATMLPPLLTSASSASPSPNVPFSRVFFGGLLDVHRAGDLILIAPDGSSATIVSSLAFMRLQGVTRGNADLSFLFFGDRFNEPGDAHQYAFINGIFTRTQWIPGITLEDAIVDVNRRGDILGRVIIPTDDSFNNWARPGEFFVVRNGVRTMVRDLIVQVIGEDLPPMEGNHNLTGQIRENGAITFTHFQNGTIRHWILQGGVLTQVSRLPLVVASDGTELTQDGGGFVLIHPDGGTTRVEGLRNVLAMNDQRQIVGIVQLSAAPSHIALAIWNNGVVTIIPGTEGFHRWVQARINNRGHVVATLERAIGFVISEDSYLFTPEHGLRRIADITTGSPQNISVLRFADDDRLLYWSGLLTPVDAQAPWVAAAGSFVAASADGADVLFVNQFGDLVRLERTASGWRGSQINLMLGAQPAPRTIIAGQIFHDPFDQRMHAIVVADTGEVFRGSLSEDGGASALVRHDGLIVASQASFFTTADGRPVLVGFDADHDLVALFSVPRTISGSTSVVWEMQNLTQVHLAPAGIALPAPASNPTAFAAPWGAMHIFFIGDDGDLYGVWFAPGMDGWSAVNLSELSGTSSLSGTLTSFMTPWNTLHANIGAADGRITSIWWAPEFGPSWAATTLIEEPPILLDPASIDAYTTPWGAINFAGRDIDTGEVAAYWWTPASQEWRVDPVRARAMPTAPPLAAPVTGPIAAAMRHGVEQNLFARDAATGDLLRLHWSIGDGEHWRVENLTRIAV